MRTAQVDVYQFHELSEKAKDKAREWKKQCITSDDFDPIETDITFAATLLGFGEKPKLLWSVGYSQSDHASIEGTWKASQWDAQEHKLKEHFGDDKRLQEVAYDFEQVAKLFPDAWAVVNEVNIIRSCDLDEEEKQREGLTEENYARLTLNGEKDLKEAIKDFNKWAYKLLRQHSDFLYSDEEVDEAIAANEYEFTSDGVRWTR